MPMDDTPGSISDPQAKYIRDLVAQKDLNGNDRWLPTQAQREYLLAGDYSAMSKLKASNAIGNLLKLNDKPAEPAVEIAIEPNVEHVEVAGAIEDYAPTPVQGLETAAAKTTDNTPEAGFYFIVDPTNGEERFFHVSKGKEGTRWEGYTFLETRGGDYTYPVKNEEHRKAVFAAIQVDPVTAMNEYGIRLGACGVCGRTLTARDSRLRGIGPICAQQLMMRDAQATPDQISMLEQLGIKKG